MPVTSKLLYTVISFIICSFIITSCNSKKKILSQAEFTAIVAATLNSTSNSTKFIISSDGAITCEKDGKIIKSFTENAYRDYLLQPDSMQQVLNTYISSTREVLKERNVKLSDVVPLIKPIDFFDDIKSMAAKTGKDNSFAYKKYNEQLMIAFAQNNDMGLNFLLNADVKKLGISMDSLMNISLQNLGKLLTDVQYKSYGNGLYSVLAGGNFEASLILVPAVWSREKFNIHGNFVIAIPARDVLLITGSADAISIAKIKETTAKLYVTGDHPISPDLFKWNGTKFIKFER